MLNSGLILERLCNKMGILQYNIMVEQIRSEYTENMNTTNIFDKFIYPKIRQYGIKINFSCRNILLDCNNNVYKYIHDSDAPYEISMKNDKEFKLKKGIIQEITIYSMWVSGRVFLFSPVMKNVATNQMYGEDITNREISNDWNKVEDYNGIYFVINTVSEIEEITNNWYNMNVKNKTINVKDISYSYISHMISELRIKDLLI